MVLQTYEEFAQHIAPTHCMPDQAQTPGATLQTCLNAYVFGSFVSNVRHKVHLSWLHPTACWALFQAPTLCVACTMWPSHCVATLLSTQCLPARSITQRLTWPTCLYDLSFVSTTYLSFTSGHEYQSQGHQPGDIPMQDMSYHITSAMHFIRMHLRMYCRSQTWV